MPAVSLGGGTAFGCWPRIQVEFAAVRLVVRREWRPSRFGRPEAAASLTRIPIPEIQIRHGEKPASFGPPLRRPGSPQARPAGARARRSVRTASVLNAGRPASGKRCTYEPAANSTDTLARVLGQAGVVDRSDSIRDVSCPQIRWFPPTPPVQRGVPAAWVACSTRGPHAAECLPRRRAADPNPSVKLRAWTANRS